MQKDEDDILHQWIRYHGNLFGYTNLYIIDNLSGQKSIEILKQYEPMGFHWKSEPNYAKKGDYLCEWIRKVQETDPFDIAIPMDIDEFIGLVHINNIPKDVANEISVACQQFDPTFYAQTYLNGSIKADQKSKLIENYLLEGHRAGHKTADRMSGALSGATLENTWLSDEKNQKLVLKNMPEITISCRKAQILHHLGQLPEYGRYSFLYYLTSRHSEIDYSNPIEQIHYFDIVDMESFENRGNFNKKFFNPAKLIKLDHGNHYGTVEGLTPNQYHNSQLILFHFHHRGIRKMIQKCKNDILGLGNVKNIADQREMKEKIQQQVNGSHNIITYLNYLQRGPNALLLNEADGRKITALAHQIKLLDTPIR